MLGYLYFARGFDDHENTASSYFFLIFFWNGVVVVVVIVDLVVYAFYLEQLARALVSKEEVNEDLIDAPSQLEVPSLQMVFKKILNSFVVV